MKSILIIGLGRFGRHMAQKFIENGNEVMAIDNNEDRADDEVGRRELFFDVVAR